MVYCIDTHTFVWGVKKQAEHDDEYRLAQAAAFLQWVHDDKHQIMVPAIVLAESLIREPVENHARIMEIAYSKFIVVDFDGRAAMKYGEILRLEKWKTANDLRKLNDIRREKMKFDHTIVACALVHGAAAIFSEDNDVKVIANGIINVRSLSEIPQQQKIFEENLFSAYGQND